MHNERLKIELLVINTIIFSITCMIAGIMLMLNVNHKIL